MAGRPLKFKTPGELQEKVDTYFDTCNQLGEPYTITGLALALDTSRETLVNYEKKDTYFDTIKRAKLKCQNYAEKFLYTSRNVTGAIFNLKVNYGWQDKQTIEHEGIESGIIILPNINEAEENK